MFKFRLSQDAFTDFDFFWEVKEIVDKFNALNKNELTTSKLYSVREKLDDVIPLFSRSISSKETEIEIERFYKYIENTLLSI